MSMNSVHASSVQFVDGFWSTYSMLAVELSFNSIQDLMIDILAYSILALNIQLLIAERYQLIYLTDPIYTSRSLNSIRKAFQFRCLALHQRKHIQEAVVPTRSQALRYSSFFDKAGINLLDIFR